MKTTNGNNLEALIHLLSSISENYNMEENADLKTKLQNEGFDFERATHNTVNAIKKLQLKIEAQLTESEMQASKNLANRAVEFVEKLLSNSNFSFLEFARSENLVLQNRNLENLTPADIKKTLIKYYTLKFIEEKGKRENEL